MEYVSNYGFRCTSAKVQVECPNRECCDNKPISVVSRVVAWKSCSILFHTFNYAWVAGSQTLWQDEKRNLALTRKKYFLSVGSLEAKPCYIKTEI